MRNFSWVESSYGIPFSSFWSATLGNEPPGEWKWTHLFRTSHTKTALPGEARKRPYEEHDYEEREYHLFVVTRADKTPLVNMFDVGADASLLIGGLKIVLSPGELVDFLGGLVFLDLAGDDKTGPSQPEQPEQPEQPGQGEESEPPAEGSDELEEEP